MGVPKPAQSWAAQDPGKLAQDSEFNSGINIFPVAIYTLLGWLLIRTVLQAELEQRVSLTCLSSYFYILLPL